MYKFLYPQTLVYQSLYMYYTTYGYISQYQNYMLKFTSLKSTLRYQLVEILLLNYLELNESLTCSLS